MTQDLQQLQNLAWRSRKIPSLLRYSRLSAGIMDHSWKLHLLGILAVAALLLVPVQADPSAIVLTYCSPQNNGADMAAKTWTWQSNGWCKDECKGNYAFAVVQGNDCWCSDYAPADQRDISDCDRTCPGYPDERCGSQDNTLFGYVLLERQPSGTQGASRPTSATGEKPTSAAPTTLKTSVSSDGPETRTQLVTVSDGLVVTQTVVYTPSAVPNTPSLSQNDKKGTNVGAIVGGVLGGIALLAAIVGVVFFLLWRRRREQQAGDDGQSGIQRNTSTMSKDGLLRTEKTPPYPPALATNIKRNSRIMMQDTDSISPVSGSDRRSSRPYIFDQRLNPSAIMNLDNTSRGSFVSMDDSRDYGRTLNVRNPDPDSGPQ